MTDIGDNLIDARDFVTSTMSSMDILVSDARLNIELAQKTLKEVRLDARTLSARGISQAAQSVLDSYAANASQPKIDGRITTLYKLVTQYAQGLDEIAPVVTTVKEAGNPQLDLEASYEAARDTLLPLLKYAGDNTGALKRLASMTQDKAVKTEGPAKTSEPHISFESLMPDVSNSALRTARTQGKSVSISYAADGLAVAESQVEHVRGELEKIVDQLVRTRIAAPEKRVAKGLSRGGHIDISALDTGKGLDISVACDGQTVTLFPTRHKKVSEKIEAQSSDDLINMSMELGT